MYNKLYILKKNKNICTFLHIIVIFLISIRFYIIFALVATANSVYGQNYFPVRNDGDLPNGYILDKIYEADKTVLLTQPVSDQLSATAQIPFDFYFYNVQYSSYKVSDNGYITFDLSQNLSLKPDSILPRNSILGFWQDFKLQALPQPNEGIGVQVFSYTLGQAPNRQHVIQFYGLTLQSDPLDQPITNTSIFAFAIILYEGNAGRFDLVYSPYGDKNKKGAIGCSNANNSQKRLLNDSLVNLPFQFSFNLDKFIVYRFIKGIQSDYDLVIKELMLDKIYPVNSIVNFSGTLSNWGEKTVNSLYLNYAVNQEDTISYLLDGFALKPNGDGNMIFTHPISWLSGALGSLNDVNFWLSGPNGTTDGISANSNQTRKVLRSSNNYKAERNVLFEEATGAWCGYCPEANLILKQSVKQHGNRVVPVSYHFADSMSNDDGNFILAAYVTSFPDAIIDRKIFLGSNSTWLAEVNTRLNVKAPVEIFIEEKNYNIQTREITYRVRVRFTDYWYGNLRLGSIVTENNVRGNAIPSFWSQYNYYSKEYGGGVKGASHPLYNEREHMDGYMHHFVNKSMPGGPWGVDGLIPILVAPNSEYSLDFTYILPQPTFVQYDIDNNTEFCNTIDIPGQNEGWNIPANINLIGYVSEYNDMDIMDRPVINAGQKRLWDLSNQIDFINSSADMISVFPNPANDIANVRVNLEQISDLRITVTNQLGQVVYEDFYNEQSPGKNVFFIHTSTFATGMYRVNISTMQGTNMSKLIILR